MATRTRPITEANWPAAIESAPSPGPIDSSKIISGAVTPLLAKQVPVHLFLQREKSPVIWPLPKI